MNAFLHSISYMCMFLDIDTFSNEMENSILRIITTFKILRGGSDQYMLCGTRYCAIKDHPEEP